MQPPVAIRPVHLYGHLAKDVGKCLHLAFRTPVEAIRLLEVNFPGFYRRFKNGEYFITIKKGERERDLPLDRLGLGFTGGSLHIMPRASGRAKGKGFLNILVGGLIIGASFMLAGPAGMSATLPGIFGATGATFGTLATMGVGLVLSGVGTLLTPQQKTDYKTADQSQSFIFNGPVNTVEQGGAVPLAFGRIMTGTTVLSAALDVEMVKGSAGSKPQGRDMSLMLEALQGSKPVPIDMGDLVTSPSGARIRKIGGDTVTGKGVWRKDTLQIEFDATRDGAGVLVAKYIGAGIGASKYEVPIVVAAKLGTSTFDTEMVLTFTVGNYTDAPAGAPGFLVTPRT